ncbi:hypothetical protein HPB48_001889 [Haemaphysalis longicornis]|uniref:NR LBD domain-containing protein n=1 Tax=Haemaphysalis longicornis TaxID=44386 RepID=A0A9J6G6E1_HAELO|nr:hypothetical protein HPB48_001889 [Haemaphysalis longicornis]
MAPDRAGVQETAAKLLFCSLRWIRSVPAFAQLCCRDQLLLLEASWSDVFLLSAAQWGFPLVASAGGCRTVGNPLMTVYAKPLPAACAVAAVAHARCAQR